jgi:glycosyltransferase involved in cell wall biosynthesis
VYAGILQDGRLLKEIGELISQYPSVMLHIGGTGVYEGYFKKLAEENQNVKYYGKMLYSAVIELEKNADVLFATYDPKIENHKFSAPNKIYEAMALKKPIIVCKGMGIDDIVEKYSFGVAINYNADEFFNTIINMDKKEMIIKGENGRKIYENTFSWGIMKKRLIKIYEEIE